MLMPNPYKGYDKFSHIKVRVTKLWSHDHIYNIIWVAWKDLVGDVIDINYDVITFIWEHFYFKKA